ncbi:MAG: thiosulfate oxidation carrier protein SoxY [Pseudomonadota bacterium]|jgi:sulfur-oxidizing protein SoxY|nr:thiosulfate oxidation carrier protein SoxY [Pseudomonadota bacterium]PQM67746.1 MAG: thiosulfate oxidation carrier protein SoxY [Rhodobacterales bacterium]|tara:strand:- start:143 stop:574 length:432 start_codon:yes stop_codon:yes gene_type:complete
MKINRRKVVITGVGVAAASLLPINLLAQSDGQSAEEIIKEFTGGASIGSGDIMLTTPEIAENGNTVPISVESKKATAIKILALGNPGPDVVTFKFGPLSATRSASTRIRLRKTQDVLAIAKLEDGSFIQDIQKVKVTIGGCGG